MEYSTDASSLAESRSSLIAEDDRVAVRAQFSGRRVGAVDGFAVIGQACSVQYIHIYRTTDGRVSEHWRAAMTAAPPATWASSATPTTRQHDARQTRTKPRLDDIHDLERDSHSGHEGHRMLPRRSD